MVQNTSAHRYHHNTSANNRPNGWSQSCEAARSSLPAAAEEIVRQGKSIRHEELWQALEWPSGSAGALLGAVSERPPSSGWPRLPSPICLQAWCAFRKRALQ
jgi:hypothetical protein